MRGFNINLDYVFNKRENIEKKNLFVFEFGVIHHVKNTKTFLFFKKTTATINKYVFIHQSYKQP